MIENVTNARVGTVVLFTYDGGRNPGRQRLVRIKDVNGGHIKGDDFSAGNQFRDFLKSSIKNSTVEVVAEPNEEVIPTSTFLPTNVSATLSAANVRGVFELMYPDRNVRGYNENARVVVVKDDTVPSVVISISATELGVDFMNSDNKRLGLSFSGNFTPLAQPIIARLDQKTFDEFANKMTQHVFGSPNPPKTTTDGWEDFANMQKHGMYAKSSD